MILDEAALRGLIEEAVRKVLREERAGAPAGEYLSVADAARAAAVTPPTIRDWIRAGRLARYHAGRELRVRRDDLERLLGAPAPAPSGTTPEQAAVLHFRSRRRR